MTTEPKTIGLRQEPGGWVFTLPAKLDGTIEESLVPAVERALASGSHLLVFDFSDVQYTSSAGVGAVVDSFRRAGARQAALVLAGVSGQTRVVFDRVGLTRCLGVYDTVVAALAAMEKK